jgi:iron(III) transport system permease protein
MIIRRLGSNLLPARPSAWRLFSALFAAAVMIPLSIILLSFTKPAGDVWRHLSQTLLTELIINTLKLAIGVGTVTAILGVSLAWLTAVCEFPGRKFFTWSLFLPLAFPTYVLAFVFLGMLDYSSPLHILLRQHSLPTLSGFRSVWGVIFVMSLSLYPYVYLLARDAFSTQGKRALEAAQSLGHTKTEGFFKVALPMARPWIAGGLMLVLMEVLADFGAVSIFNYDTFTTAIYKAWFGFFSLAAAAQLSSILVVFALIILGIENSLRSRMQFTSMGRDAFRKERLHLGGAMKVFAVSYAFLILFVSFIVPVIQLILWTTASFRYEFSSRYFDFLGHSLVLGIITAAIICLLALILSYAGRHHPDILSSILTRICTMGYALPGTVLAIGIFIPVAAADGFLAGAAGTFLNVEPGPVLQGTIFVMVAAYIVRFMAPGFNSIDSSMRRITRSIDESARTLGSKGLPMLYRIHLPILKGGLFSAAALVFVDVMKEMPITLMTRPFGWDTLAVKIFELTSEGEWERAALPALTLILVGIIPVALLTRQADD